MVRRIASFIASILLATSAFSDEPKQPGRKLRVGIIAPMTGAISTWGVSVRNAIEEANKYSGQPADLFFEDEESCNPSKTLTAFNYLSAERKVDVLVASCLEGAQAIAPLAKRAGIPFFISGRSSKDFQTRYPHALSWLSLLDSEGQAITGLIKEKGWKRGAALVWDGYFGVQFAHGIQSALREQQVVFDLDVIETQQNSTPGGGEVQRILRGRPEVLFLFHSEPAAAFVVKQLRALHYSGAIVLQSSMLQTYDPKVRATFSGALQVKFPVDELEFQRLHSLLKEKQGEDVADDFVFSYDGFRALLSEAALCEKAQAPSFEACLTNRLRNETWREGASGRFRFMKDGSTERPMLFKVITEEGLK